MSVQIIKFAPGLKPVLKHLEGQHDQSTHGSWAEGSQGSARELSDDEIRDVIYNSKTVNEMFQKVAKRQGKSMKPSVDTLSEDEITHYRGVQDVSRDAQRLLDGKVKFTEFQTWGQGIYLAEDKSIASNYGTLIGMKLDASAKIVRGETTWDSAFDVNYENSSARTRNTTTSSFIDLGRIETQIRAGKMDNLSISDMRNVYWAAKGYDGFTTYGETVLFNGSKLTINKADIGSAIQKHLAGQHDQQSHGSWATGGEIANWNPTDAIPDSPKNAGGMTAKSWEAWEHGPDGQNFIALFRKYACQELGLEVPKTPFDQGGYLNYMMDRGWGKPSRDEAKGMLNAIANGRPQPALYRGMYDSNDAQDQASLDALLSTKPGDTFDMPLVSTTRSLGVATWYAADMVGAGKRSIIMKIQDGAKGVALKKENSTYPQDHEVITSGKFEIVSINKVSTPYWSRSVFEPRFTAGDAQYPDHYEVVTYDKTRFTPEQAKTAWDAVSSGNYKSLETPTFKLTADRSGGALSSWTKQEGKEFTVIEVKMVEPHTVQKSQDFGNQFFFLFNNMPFIHDEPKGVLKHGTHDQKTHGNWANGSSESGLDSMPYEWKPKLNKSNMTDKEYAKNAETLKNIAKAPVSTYLYGSELDLIVQEGRFKSLNEIPIKNEGLVMASEEYRQGRSELEHDLWGVPKTGVQPIYGYMDTDYENHKLGAGIYGDVKVTLKDNVAGRTTFCAGDSLNSTLVPVKVSDARAGTLSKPAMEGAYTSQKSETYRVESELKSPERYGYFEAQVHGGVSLKDIKTVSISQYSRVAQSTQDTLKALGVEVIRLNDNR